MARIFFATTIIVCFVIAALLMYDGLQPKQESPAPVQETAVAEEMSAPPYPDVQETAVAEERTDVSVSAANRRAAHLPQRGIPLRAGCPLSFSRSIIRHGTVLHKLLTKG